MDVNTLLRGRGSLFPFQVRTVDAVIAALAKLSVLLVSPTGSGKTRMAAYICSLVKGRVLWITHRHELVDQAVKELERELGKGTVGVILSGRVQNPNRHIQVASIQTLLARGVVVKNVTLLVFDEAHHYAADTWKSVHDDYPKAATLGLTATPERADGKGLDDIFDVMIEAAKVSELIAGGYLVTARVWTPPRPLNGDLAMSPREAYLRYGEGAKAIVFTSSIDRAVIAAASLHKARARPISADTEELYRMDSLELFRNGSVDVLTNVYALTEGLDVPNVRCVILARAFAHRSTLIQAVGRALRPAEGKADAIIIDLVGCIHKHGLPDQDIDWSLEGTPPLEMEATGEREPPIRHAEKVLGLDLQLVARGALPPNVTPLVQPVTAMDPAEIAHIAKSQQDLRTRLRRTRVKHGFAAAELRERLSTE